MRFSAVLSLGAFLLTACAHVPEKTLRRFESDEPHMGTVFRIVLYAPASSTAQLATHAAFKRIHDLEWVMTDYEAESELMRLCRRPAGIPVKVSRDLFDVLKK